MLMQIVNVEFTLQPQDIIAFRRYLGDHLANGRQKSRVHRWTVAIFPFVLLGILIAAILRRLPPELTNGFRDATVYYLWLLIVLVLCFVFRRRIVAIAIRRNYHKAPPNSPWKQHRKVAVSPESFTIATELSSITNRWGAVQRIAFTNDYLFMFVSPNEAHLIPRRAFRNSTEWNDLTTMLKTSFPGHLQDESRR